MHQAIAFRLPATVSSVSVARSKVRSLLGAWEIPPEMCDDALLVISELVTNGIAHSGSEYLVCRLRRDAARLHIEVEDQAGSGTLPTRQSPSHDDQGGRGLLLVSALTSNWGIRTHAYGAGRIVWAELPESPATATPPGAARHTAEKP
jgi:anti-sigma regulatory factor (Ser/Thr protein kinase)